MVGHFIANYGYLAIFIGTLLEGETILLAAGFAVHRGLLDWRLVLLAAVVGATAGDQLAFLMGRWKGNALIARFPSLVHQAARVKVLLERYHAPFILAVRFMYGLRVAGPLILGTGPLPLLRFAILNVIGAVIWAFLVVGAGYAFGATIESWLTDLKRIEEAILGGILFVGLLVWVWRRIR